MPTCTLGDLADSTKHNGPLDLTGYDGAALRTFLRDMMSIRTAEQKLASARRDGFIAGPVHLGVGQEAVAVGVSASLRHSDRIFGAHRSHSHLLAMGASVHGLFAETLGRDTGLSRGMGGSMHLWDQPHGFYGSVPIVAGTVSLAVGAALAAKLTGSDDVGVAYFGDGATEEGVVHESFNLARILGAPVLFVVENNLFSSHMHISLRQPHDSTARFAAAHDIRYEIVDGNDVVAVAKAARRLTTHAREGGGPAMLEAVTHRWFGHVDWREDVDVGVNRSSDDLANWRLRDPVLRLAKSLASVGICTKVDQEAMAAEIVGEVEQAWQRALADPFPPYEALLERVYAPRYQK